MSTSTDAVLAYGWAWSEEFGVLSALDRPREIELERVLGKLGLELDFHCSDECTMPALVVKASRTLASRGYPEKISAPLAAQPEWDEALRQGLDLVRKACGSLDYPPEFLKGNDPPGWVLYSWWG